MNVELHSSENYRVAIHVVDHCITWIYIHELAREREEEMSTWRKGKDKLIFFFLFLFWYLKRIQEASVANWRYRRREQERWGEVRRERESLGF